MILKALGFACVAVVAAFLLLQLFYIFDPTFPCSPSGFLIGIFFGAFSGMLAGQPGGKET